jgi:ABC-type oligopeptide transport system substrate-binding subunit
LYGFGIDSIYRDPDGYLRTGMLFCSDWRDPVYFDLVERARGILDHQERMRLYRQAEEILRDQAPIMPALYLRKNLLIKPWVRNYPLRDFSSWHWFDVMIIDPH